MSKDDAKEMHSAHKNIAFNFKGLYTQGRNRKKQKQGMGRGLPLFPEKALPLMEKKYPLIMMPSQKVTFTPLDKLRTGFDTSRRRLSGFGASATGRTLRSHAKCLISRSW